MTEAVLVIWLGIVLVLGVLVWRVRSGAWRIENDDTPPKPGGLQILLTVLGLLLVGSGSVWLLRGY